MLHVSHQGFKASAVSSVQDNQLAPLAEGQAASNWEIGFRE